MRDLLLLLKAAVVVLVVFSIFFIAPILIVGGGIALGIYIVYFLLKLDDETPEGDSED